MYRPQRQYEESTVLISPGVDAETGLCGGRWFLLKMQEVYWVSLRCLGTESGWLQDEKESGFEWS